MGKVLIIKDADFSVNAIETVVPYVLIEQRTLTTFDFDNKIFNRSGDIVDVSNLRQHYASHFIAIPNGCTKIKFTSANQNLAPSWVHCWNSSTPSSSTWLGLSDNSSYDSFTRGEQNLNKIFELQTGTTHIGWLAALDTAIDYPITINFYE
jgi:hypothetical protein